LPRSSRGGGNGSSAWTRTKDPAVNSRLLYRLSYAGIGGESLAIGAGPSSLFREESHGGSGSGFRAYGRTGCRRRERSSATGGVENAARSSADHSLLEGVYAARSEAMQRKPSKKPLTVRKAANQAKKAHAAKSRKGAKGSVRQQGAGTRGQSGGKAAAAAVSATRTTRTAAAKRRPRASSVSEASSAASVLDLRLRAGGELESSVSEASSAASVRTAKPSRAASAK